MNNVIRVLVSNRALPSDSIGSWTTRINQFLDANPYFFYAILSPNKSSNAFYSKKRPFFSWKSSLRKLQLQHWVARDYLKKLDKLSRLTKKLIVVVMDDPHLVEAIGAIKGELKCKVELIYSFHGFELSLSQKVVNSIDKILFLTQKGLQKSKDKYDSFPCCTAVGNTVSSEHFYTLNAKSFKTNREINGYSEEDKVLIWMSNDRPKKGFHIFEKVASILLKEDTNLHILIIGSDRTIDHTRVKSIGRIPNREVADFLQLGDCYMFTTLYEEGFGLSLIEAYKCGNTVIASNLGGITEVLKDLPETYLIDTPEDINEWLSTYRQLSERGFKKDKRSESFLSSIWTFDNWEKKFINAIDKECQS